MPFHYIDDNGNSCDSGIVDELLRDGKDIEIRRQLIEAGVIKNIILKSITDEEARELDAIERGKPDI